MALLVVPKSIPKIFDILFYSVIARNFTPLSSSPLIKGARGIYSAPFNKGG